VFIKKEWKVCLFVIQKCIHNIAVTYFNLLVILHEQFLYMRVSVLKKRIFLQLEQQYLFVS
jgi:hypothetical protein